MRLSGHSRNPDPPPQPHMSDEPIIDLSSDDYFMGEALRQAMKAWDSDEVPIGAVIVHDGRIIARAFNQVELLNDATAHAEMLALTAAEEALGNWRLNGCTLFVTKEPCPMCAGALIQARMGQIIFGANDLKRGALGGTIDLANHKSAHHKMIVSGGIMRDQSRQLLTDWFKNKRIII